MTDKTDFRKRFAWLAAEFAVVILGVFVALAADGWRENLQASQTEREYLIRIVADFERGQELLLEWRGNDQEALNAGHVLLDYLNGARVEQDLLTDSIVRASRIGTAVGSSFVHDVTYRELISTGRFNTISNLELRTKIIDYYREVDGQISRRDGLNPFMLETFTRVTGHIPFRYLQGTYELDEPNREKFLDKISSNTEIEEILNQQSAFIELCVTIYDVILDRNKLLVAELKDEI